MSFFHWELWTSKENWKKKNFKKQIKTAWISKIEKQKNKKKMKNTLKQKKKRQKENGIQIHYFWLYNILFLSVHILG